MAMEVAKTIRLKVKREAYPWLNAAAREVNQVWNWANETSEKAIRRYAGPPKWLTGYDLDKLSSGATKLFGHIGAQTINRVNHEYASKRRTAKKARLSWRRSGGSRKSLGWVPFRADNIKRKGRAVRYAGKVVRIFEPHLLDGATFRDGCFAQDAVGDWWLCLPVSVDVTEQAATEELVGIDLGLKDTATTSHGERLIAGRYYRDMQRRIAQAQQRSHKAQARRLHRKAARQRADAIHKFTRKIVNQYQTIVVGDVSSAKLARTSMGKSVLDSGWSMLRTQLQYKGQQAGRRVQIVNEAYTTRACSGCGSICGPAGRTGLVVREWQCVDCGAMHDRDVNAAKNIAILGSRYLTSVSGNDLERRGLSRLDGMSTGAPRPWNPVSETQR